MLMRFQGRIGLLAGIGVLSWCAAAPLAAAPIPGVVAAIRVEAVRASDDPAGRPLPLAGHWNRGAVAQSYNSFVQRDLIEAGHHLLPNLDMPLPGTGADSYEQTYGDLIRTYAEWGVPITIRGTNWHADALRQPRWADLPAETTPLLVKPDGTIDKGVADPFGPVDAWTDMGGWLTDQAALQRIQELYPNPPKVLFLSNNETMTLKGGETGRNSGRYIDRYGSGHSHDFKNHLVGSGYAERFGAMIDGMRGGLAADAWRQNATFAGYGNIGPAHYARWNNWKFYSTSGAAVTEDDAAGNPVHFDAQMSYAHRGWEGGSAPFYTHDWNASTDYRVWSPQVEAMNWAWMQRDIYAENPGFWFELSIWDGSHADGGKKADYEAAGQAWSPQRYGGSTQFGMWLTTPRVVREFRGHSEDRADFPGYFEALLEGVDRVHETPLLQRFWRKGELVANTSQEHPYQTDEIPQFDEAPRWFLLDATTNPDTIAYNDVITVFALARVLGEAGSREWLLYAHAPLGDQQGVGITVPGYGVATVEAPVEGAFYWISESTRKVIRVTDGMVPEPTAAALLAAPGVLLLRRAAR